MQFQEVEVVIDRDVLSQVHGVKRRACLDLRVPVKNRVQR